MNDVTLALEATDRGGSVALGKGDRLLEAVYENSDVSHSERLMPTVDRLLEKRNLSYRSIDRVAVARGPGSFTAVRLAVTTAKTLSMVCEAKLHAAGSLLVLAKFAEGCNRLITSVIDARRGEVYVQKFEPKAGCIEPLTDPAVMATEELSITKGVVVFRDRNLNWSDLPTEETVRRLDGPISRPLAVPLWQLTRSGQPVDNPDTVTPYYLRKSDAQRSTTGDDT